jgi:hypothetical protein
VRVLIVGLATELQGEQLGQDVVDRDGRFVPTADHAAS